MAKLLVDMIVLIAVLLLSSSSAVHGSSNLYSLTATDFNGEQVALNRYKGKVWYRCSCPSMYSTLDV